MRSPAKAGAVVSRGGVSPRGSSLVPPPGWSPVPPPGVSAGFAGAGGAIVVGSLAPSFAVFSPERLTAAVLITLDGASGATSTVTVIAGYASPAANVSLRVQVNEANVQSQPSPAIAVAVRPCG